MRIVAPVALLVVDGRARPGATVSALVEVTAHRGVLRLTEQALAELRGHIDRLAAPCADEETEGTWARVVVALVDLEDRPERDE